MDRLSMGLGIGCVVLIASNLYFFSVNGQLRDEVGDLRAELDEAREELTRAEERVDKVKAAARTRMNRPRRLPVRVKGDGVGPGVPGGGAMRPGAGPNRQRVAEVREKVREQARARMAEKVAEVGAERGWSDEVIDEATAILDDSWEVTHDIRERMRAREIDPAAAREEMIEARKQVAADLAELLGPEEHAALREKLQEGSSAGAGEE